MTATLTRPRTPTRSMGGRKRKAGPAPWTDPGVLAAIRLLEDTSPSDLPDTPWVLHTAPMSVIGGSVVPAAPFVRITNNESWLRSLRQDVAQGAKGPRTVHGSLQRDLKAMVRVICGA